MYENVHTLERQAWLPTDPAPLVGEYDAVAGCLFVCGYIVSQHVRKIDFGCELNGSCIYSHLPSSETQPTVTPEERTKAHLNTAAPEIKVIAKVKVRGSLFAVVLATSIVMLC